MNLMRLIMNQLLQSLTVTLQVNTTIALNECGMIQSIANTSSTINGAIYINSSIDAFEQAVSSANRTSTVICCFPETGDTEEETCGMGESCAAKCSALGAELCPSGICTDDPKDWEVPFTGNEELSVSTLNPADLKWCAPQCRVQAYRECCYYHLCFSKREKSCTWFNFLAGEYIVFTSTKLQ